MEIGTKVPKHGPAEGFRWPTAPLALTGLRPAARYFVAPWMAVPFAN
jgi:hypothetical protein